MANANHGNTSNTKGNPLSNQATQSNPLLASWIALEALMPKSYIRPEELVDNDRKSLATLSSNELPWDNGAEVPLPKHVIYYEVILGAIRLDRATEEIVRCFGEGAGDDEEEIYRSNSKASIAAILVDSKGCLVGVKSIAVSSFAWALPLALKLEVAKLKFWSKVEGEIIDKVDQLLRRFDPSGEPIPLDFAILLKGYQLLVSEFGLPEHLVEPPTFAVRNHHFENARSCPDASILNSFYLRDLVKAASLVDRNIAPHGLLRYLGVLIPRQSADLLNDRSELEKAVAPAMMPAVRWPSPGGHPLVLLQQAAVNLARAELAGDEGIIAVNGPPGTGKTTLLRDMVAACVFDRASAMVAFDDPNKAFIYSGEKLAVGENALFRLYTLAESLKGHEILVASSNNKAVENISKELPAAKAIGRSVEELSYFKSVSDLLFDASDESGGGAKKNSVSFDPVETWGLCAAVLGSSKNRTAFKNLFWWHEDRSFRLYLKAANGEKVMREVKDPDTGKVDRRLLTIVLAEQPPTPEVAKENWKRAKERFELLKHEVQTELNALEQIRLLCRELTMSGERWRSKMHGLQQLRTAIEQIQTQVACSRADVVALKQQYERRIATLESHRTNQPGFFHQLVRSKRLLAWQAAHTQLTSTLADVDSNLQNAQAELQDRSFALSDGAAEITKMESELINLQQRMHHLSQTVEGHRQILGERLIDEQFFRRGHSSVHLTAPWIPDSLHRKREELFSASLAVHKAFIDVCAQKILHNLSVLMDTFSGAPLDEAKRRLVGDLWSTLFLVVPVVSSTFASIERMLGDMPPGSIGWLLIDEAGQAIPQAAVGAVMRARRTVVVGDPLQIPPVMAMPERLNFEICRFFKVDSSVWSAPGASTQTLADRASKFQASFNSERGPRRVGVPLLVHRRCQEPMFGISNRIAYDGQMVHAPGARDPGPIGAVLGPSKWFDVAGEARSKWCPAEGELVVALLSQLADAGIFDPDLFIITPFKDVASGLKVRLSREKVLFSRMLVDVNEWTKTRIGTIHTVQGREANTVFLVLGAPKQSQNGARSWATATPNILNVAVSRAKQNLYLIGSFDAWSGGGHGREVASVLAARVEGAATESSVFQSGAHSVHFGC